MAKYIPTSIVEFINEQIDHFAEEALRLKSRKPLEDYKELTDAYFTVQKNLGTLQHEVALDAARKQFSLVRKDIITSLAKDWREFWTTRRRAKKLIEKEIQLKQDRAKRLGDFERSVEELNLKGSFMASDFESALKLMQDAEQLDMDFGHILKKTSWTMLYINLRVSKIYFHYLFSRAKVFAIFHGFIFLVPIALLGIGYSFASKSVIDWLSNFSGQLPWLALGLLVATYALKKYYIDKKLKKLQIALESKLFASLSFRLLATRTIAMQIRVSRMSRIASKIDA